MCACQGRRPPGGKASTPKSHQRDSKYFLTWAHRCSLLAPARLCARFSMLAWGAGDQQRRAPYLPRCRCALAHAVAGTWIRATNTFVPMLHCRRIGVMHSYLVMLACRAGTARPAPNPPPERIGPWLSKRIFQSYTHLLGHAGMQGRSLEAAPPALDPPPERIGPWLYWHTDQSSSLLRCRAPGFDDSTCCTSRTAARESARAHAARPHACPLRDGAAQSAGAASARVPAAPGLGEGGDLGQGQRDLRPPAHNAGGVEVVVDADVLQQAAGFAWKARGLDLGGCWFGQQGKARHTHSRVARKSKGVSMGGQGKVSTGRRGSKG